MPPTKERKRQRVTNIKNPKWALQLQEMLPNMLRRLCSASYYRTNLIATTNATDAML